ncbi:MAG: Ig-like domain-containing protein, partial [Granulosicoccus sp.]
MLVPKRSMRLLSASAFFLSITVYAASSHADPTQTVQSGQWTQISIPADPGSNGTVASLFGDDLPSAQYGPSGSWLMYRFDSAAYEYSLVGLNEPLQANTGYWLFQRVGQSVELDIPDSLSPLSGTTTTGCIAGRQCATVPLTGSSANGIWNMVGYSSDSQTTFGDTRFVTASGVCADGCTPAQARAANVIYDVMYTLNDAGTAYEAVTESSAMQPWDGYWLLVQTDADQPRWVVPVSTGSGPQPPGGNQNQAPVAANDTIGSVPAAGTSVINVTANDSDPDGTIVPTTVSIISNPSSGFVFVTNTGSVRYTHNGSAGTTSDSFSYTVADNAGAVSNVATVTISSIDYPQVQNQAPVAQNDSVGPGTIGGTLTFSVTSNDSDPDGSVVPSSVAIVSAPSAGTASVTSNGQVTYTHNGNASALSDSLAYRVADNEGAFSNTATVSISISGNDSGNVPLETPANGVGEDAFVNFESGHVRPIVLSDDGNRLFVVNTPNSTLDIFNVNGAGLTFAHSVPVGLEPVAVSLRGSEAWVVNHLSDSVSIVDISAFTPFVSKTLLVGDEPRDVVFAGQNNQFAFVTAAHRGQNGPSDNPIDAKLFTPSVGRADVWVFDAEATGNSLGGNPIDVVNLFGDVPRALAVSEDGNSVYAAILHSGNRTTTIALGFAKHGPTTSADGVEQPETSVIVQFNGTDWVDERGSASDLQGRVYNDHVPFSLPDYDVFEIEADSSPRVTRRISGVGTTLFNMAVDPASGDVFVTNTEALNIKRFEGEAETASEPTETLRSNFIQSRISIIDDLSNVSVRDLNSQLDFDRPATEQERATAVSQPLGMALTGDSLYVAAYASRSVARYNINELRNDTFTNTESSQATLSGGGPTGMAVDSTRNRLYVVTRFNNSVAIVDAQSMIETSAVQLYNPEPRVIKAGREIMYDATRTSSHGTGSCGACHIFGDTDHLAWDLGNPDGRVTDNPLQFASPVVAVANPTFHPMKGPMATQSLRGLPNTGALHWRGDRTGLNGQPGESQERAAFREFNATFPELLGRDSEISDEAMGRFADFTLTMQYPPNPIRRLDNSLTPAQQRGRDDYLGIGANANIFGVPIRIPSTAVVLECQSCHTLDPDQGFFGTSGLVSF